MTNIKKLNINKFRGIENEEIILGEHLTAVMGQNGAQKSTILGMLAQPFNHSKAKNIINQSFTTKFSEIFNFSEEFDLVGEHRYSMELFPNSKLVEQLPKKAISFNVNSRKRSGEFCLFTYDTNETEISSNKSEFRGLIKSYKTLKEEILSGNCPNKTITKSHKKNELSLKLILNYFKEDKIEKIYMSSTPNNDNSKTDLIIELKAASTHLRFVTGNTNNGGEGNLTLPVIYLGLSRVAPIGEIDRDFIKLMSIEKLKDYKQEIAIESKNILLDFDSPDYLVTPLNIVDSPENTRVGIHTAKYSPISMSAGQDNIGKILSSVYSFKQLRAEMGNDYIGGLLLIDELDATLYPGAQKALIKFMKKMSKELNLQIVFTTHSVHIVDEMYSEYHKNKYSINYLKRKDDGTLKNDNEMTPENIYYEIAVQSKSPIPKIPCLCEDNVGANMLKALISISDEYSKDDFEFINTQANFNILKNLMGNPNRYMQHNIYVIDGDHPEIVNSFNDAKIKHTGVTLPLDAPELVLCLFITEDISSDHMIFQDYEYNKQELTARYNEIKHPNAADKSKSFVKSQAENGKRIFQNDCEDLFLIWAEWFKQNKPGIYNDFINQFKSAYGLVIKNINMKI